MKNLLLTLGVCALIGICGCNQSNRPYPKRNIVCDDLYQGDSIEGAITFTGSPDDTRKTDIKFLSRQDKLAQGKELKFANRLFNCGKTRNVEDYKSLLSNKMKKLLAAKDKHSLLNHQIRTIEDGQAFSGPCEVNFHGKCDARFVVTFGEIDKKMLDDSNWYYFPDKPTHQLGFFHFHKANYSMIGGMHYVIKKGSDYKIVAGSFKNKDVPEYEKPTRVVPVKFSGIEKKTLMKVSTGPRERWEIGISEADNKSNKFEVVKTTEVINGEKKLDADLAEKVLVDYAYFAVRANVWDYIRLGFYINLKTEPNQTFGPDKGRLFCGVSFGTGSTTASLIYPGKEISNIILQEEGVFENGKLTLLSFDSTGKDGTIYRNSVFVRLTPK
ncbi:MAG: hypothetical protein K9M75_04975 [Phycisphaerae bacterium]|nr:hypothetical protein [Phycisphaerae bacterium]